MASKKHQTVVVTGAALGIGRGLARAAAARGMNLVIGDINEPALETLATELREAGVEVLAQRLDVSDPDAMEGLADSAWSRFGSVDIVINNAGIEVGGKSWDLSGADWRRVLDVNLIGPANGVRAFVPRMIAAATPAHFVIVTSLGALGAIGGQAPYMASKHAAQSLCESLFLELSRDAPFIKVSSVLPAAVSTGIWRNALGDHQDKARQTLTKITEETGLDADEAGRMILEQIIEGRYWITTDPEMMRNTAALRAEFLTTQRDPFWQFDPNA